MHLVGVPWVLVVVGAFGPAYVARAWTRLHAIDANVSRRDVEIGLLDQLPMFRPLALPAIEGLADRLEVHEVAVGETVVAQGDHGARFFVIQRGTARVVRDGIVLRDMAHGDGFGEIALLRDVPAPRVRHRHVPVAAALTQPGRLLAAVTGHAASREATETVVAGRLDADGS